MTKQQTIEEQNRLAEEQERALKNEERRGQYYGDGNKSTHFKRRANFYIFRPEDLDNDDIISAVETTPTYKRTRDILAGIGNQNVAPQQAEPQPSEPQLGTISFV